MCDVQSERFPSVNLFTVFLLQRTLLRVTSLELEPVDVALSTGSRRARTPSPAKARCALVWRGARGEGLAKRPLSR